MSHKNTLLGFAIVSVGVLALAEPVIAQTSLRYTQDIYFGLRNSQVTQLQQDIAKDLTIYPEKLVTGYFGPLTLRAVKNFQAKYGIRQTGYVGPITRGKLNELYGGSTSNSQIIIKTVGEKESSFWIKKINPDSVEGLWFNIYPVAIQNDPGTPKTLHIGDSISYACEGISEKLTSIDFSGQKITLTKIVGQPPIGGCPICLSSKTLIDTPSGSVLVKDLKVGMSIWTIDKVGHRVSTIVTKTSKVPVPPTHQMVHLVFSDGRELFASPGHPTVDGRSVGGLMPDDIYDGASIVSAKRVPYADGATFDVLPSGETGFYWANGVLLGSTLHSN